MKDISLELKTNLGDFDLIDSKESLYQDENIILNSYKGNIINNLLLGVGLIRYLNGPINLTNLKYDINNEFKKDAIFVKSITIVNDEINIDATRK